MNTKRTTVLVLGAGASRPYNFPTGQMLIDSIVWRFKDRVRRLVHKGVLESQRLSDATLLVEKLLASDAESIDVFLDYNPNLVETGKLAIALEILHAESGTVFFPKDSTARERRRRDHWYKYLWNILASDRPDAFPSYPVKIITFNYDRSLEEYLFQAFQGLFDAGRGAASFHLKRLLPICHVHGQIGQLPWQSGDGPTVPYGMNLDVCSAEVIRAAVEGISILTEDIEKSGSIGLAREWLSDAQVVAFLGFGYHPLNLQRLLDTLDLPHLRVVTGSCFGFTWAEVDDVARRIRRVLSGARRLGPGDEPGAYEISRHQGSRTLITRLILKPETTLDFLRESHVIFRDT